MLKVGCCVQAHAETARRAEEATTIRGEPLGADRRQNRYWRMLVGGEADPECAAARLWIESHVDGAFRRALTP